VEITEHLIKNKADVNAETMENGTTPLIIAIMNNRLEIVKMLLKNGAEVNKTALNGQTVLHIAVRFGSLDIVEYLIKNNADINRNSPNFGTPLIFATMNGNFNVIQSLVQNNAEINAHSTDGWSALHWAVTEIHSLEILNYLIKNGAHVDVNTEIGSPLHFAASFGHLKMIKILIYHGANVNSVKEINGFLPLHEAAQRRHFEVCRYLITHGANVHEKTKDGFSAYDLASLNGDVLLAEFLFRNHDLDIIALN